MDWRRRPRRDEFSDTNRTRGPTKKKDLAAFASKSLIHNANFGSSTRARTWDLRINSPALYQLSYRGIEPLSIAWILCLRSKIDLHRGMKSPRRQRVKVGMVVLVGRFLPGPVIGQVVDACAPHQGLRAIPVAVASGQVQTGPAWRGDAVVRQHMRSPSRVAKPSNAKPGRAATL